MNNQELNILIVDDDREDVLLAESQLREGLQGVPVELDKADSFAQGLRQVEKTCYDLLLLDYQLGEKNGLDLMRDVRAKGIATPVIFLTGHGDEQVAVETMKLGAADYVRKDHLSRLGPAVMGALQGPRRIAYLSMEIALEAGIPTYSGGLGILAGDTVRAAADQRVPMVAISLLYRSGYFVQRFDSTGWQIDEPVHWNVAEHLHEMAPRTTINIEKRPVVLCAWKYSVRGVSGFLVPVYFLDTDLPENSEWDRGITSALYRGDWYLRMCPAL